MTIIIITLQSEVFRLEGREASIWNSSPENEYEQFCVVAFVSRPAARGTGMHIARVPDRWLSDCYCGGLSVRQGKW